MKAAKLENPVEALRSNNAIDPLLFS